MVDVSEYNRRAWDAIARSHRKWFVPVSTREIAAARDGNPRIQVTACQNIPRAWLGDLAGCHVLCLAAGGGHQAPLLAAAGAHVTVVDISDAQLEIDRQVAAREGLSLRTHRCDMSQLGELGTFDLVINPCSVNFVPCPQAVWSEAHRVLRPGGILIAGLINPINYLFDAEELLQGRFVARHPIPLTPNTDRPLGQEPSDASPLPVEFGHTLSELLGAQLTVGFQLLDMFEDRWGDEDPLSERIAVFLATRARKA